MTNKMIIFLESAKLLEDGILKGSGQVVEVEDAEGNKKSVELPEEIHTYSAWKSLGYQVQKGEKAVAQFPIWKYMKKKGKQQEEVADDEEIKEEQQNGYCRMVNAYFFTKAQVQPIETV